MSDPVYTRPKVYDYQKMPPEVKEAVSEIYRELGNDTFIEYFVCEFAEDYTEAGWPKQAKLLDEWLVANGSVSGDEVLIKHWW